MTYVAAVFALMAVVIHGYLFVLAALRFDAPVARGVFRITSEEQAQAARPWAYQYGFFHLFLAVVVAAGVVILLWGSRGVGVTVIVVGAALMVATAVLHGAVDRSLRLAAAAQCLAPLLAIYSAVAAR